MNKEAIKTPSARDDFDLLELVCQLHSRALRVQTEEMHNHYWEARNELEKRLKLYASKEGSQVNISDEDMIGFAEWIRNNTVADGAPMLLYRKTNARLTTFELLQLYKESLTK